MAKGVYLASCRAKHPRFNILYNDYDEQYKPDILGDMLDVKLEDFDYIIATPPCNYYSRANYRRDISDYSLNTKHLLPDILKKCIDYDKPFIIENVRNESLMKNIISYADKNGVFVYFCGRHTYFTNIMINLDNLKFDFDFHNRHYAKRNGLLTEPITHLNGYRQGGFQVHFVIDFWLEYLHNIMGWNYER